MESGVHPIESVRFISRSQIVRSVYRSGHLPICIELSRRLAMKCLLLMPMRTRRSRGSLVIIHVLVMKVGIHLVYRVNLAQVLENRPFRCVVKLGERCSYRFGLIQGCSVNVAARSWPYERVEVVLCSRREALVSPW